MSDPLKNVLLKVPSVDTVKKKTSPSSPRDFFEKLYGHLDSAKEISEKEFNPGLLRDENKLLKLKIHQPLPLKLFYSQHGSEPCYRYLPRKENLGREDRNGDNVEAESSDCDVDIESETDEEVKSKIDKHFLIRDFIKGKKEPVTELKKSVNAPSTETSLDKTNANLRQDLSWKTRLADPLEGHPEGSAKSPGTSYPPPLSLPYPHRPSEDPHQPFFLRPFLGPPHEGAFPPGFTAFRK